MANKKNVQLKKLVSGVMTELFPKTLANLVAFDDGKNAAEKIAEVISLLSGKTSLSEVESRVQEIIGSAPAALDTLNELATALNNDPNFASTITTALTGKEGLIKNASAKTALVDNDTLPLSDSASSNDTKKITFANLKASLKAYTDTLYNKVSVNNSLTSTSTSEALSAAQGKALQDNKLDKTAQAVDSLKLGGKAASEFASSAQGARADSALQSIPFETVAGNIKAPGSASAGTSGKVADSAHIHPLQTSVSGNAGTATKLATSRKINGVPFDGTSDISVVSARVILGSDPGDMTEFDLLFEEIV